MVEIQFFGLTIESTKLQLFVAAIGVIVAIIFGYLNYKKKSAIASPKTSQFVNDSSGVLQQSYKDVTIAQQTINLTPIFADRLTTIIEYYLNPNIL